MDSWFISDHHLWHDNIIAYGQRPFKDVWEMNDALLTLHNKRVKPQDHVSFLGDVTLLRSGKEDREMFTKEIKKYNGHKRLYLGNHDHWPVQVYLAAGFEKVYATWRDQQGVVFSHMPIHPTAMGYSAIANVHGHIHQNKSPEPVYVIDKKTQKVSCKPYVNISVEAINYQPVHYDELMAMIRRSRDEWDGESVDESVLKSPKEIKTILQPPVPRFHLDPKYCEICAPEDQRMQRYRCADHYTS